MVVAVGLMLVEPLADVDVNVPGLMAIVVAPVAAQLSALLVPEFMVAGFAVKEVIAGAEPFPEGEVEPQPTNATPANRTMAITASARKFVLGSLGSTERMSVQNEVVEFMKALVAVGHSQQTQSTVRAVATVALLRCRPYDRLQPSKNRVMCEIRCSTIERPERGEPRQSGSMEPCRTWRM